MKMNIMAIGAHPDDIELGCGGTLSKHLDLGDNVYTLVLTKGEKGNHPIDKQECISSLNKLGIKKENYFFGNFKDGFLKDEYNTVNFIENYINKLNIQRVYTHDSNDRHQDHRNCSLAVSSASRKIQEILLFQGPSTKTPFEPHYFIELSKDNLRRKIDCLSLYKSQILKKTVNLNWVRSLAELVGSNLESNYAEAFSINHLLKRKNEI